METQPKLNFFERAADVVLGGRLKSDQVALSGMQQHLKVADALFQEMYHAYLEGPYRIPPKQMLGTSLAEQYYDPAVIQEMVRNMEYELVGGLGSMDGSVGMFGARTRAMDEARMLFMFSPLVKWSINLWTSFGLGEKVAVKPVDKDAAEAWNDFATDENNEPVLSDVALHTMSNSLKRDGNRFLVWFAAEVDGSLTVRSINPSEITEIVRHPTDDQTPLFYRRQWTPKGATEARDWYYPAWRVVFSNADKSNQINGPAESILDQERPEHRAARKNGIRGFEQERTLAQEVLPSNIDHDKIRTDKMFSANGSGTVAFIYHIADNQIEEGSLWGWPITTDGAPWLRSVQRYFEARLSVAMAKAQFVRRTKVEGGSRAAQSIQQVTASAYQQGYLSESNPAPAPASEDIGNMGVNTTELPMTTGAGDARTDGEMFVWMALLSLGLFPHYAGIDTQRFATVTGMEKPLLIQFTRYQLFWTTVFRTMVKIVLRAQVKWNDGTYENEDAEVSIDKLVELDLKGVTDALGQFFRDIMNPNLESGLVPANAGRLMIAFSARQVLQALGAGQVESIAGDEVFEVMQNTTEAKVATVGKLIEMVTEGELDGTQFAALTEQLFAEEIAELKELELKELEKVQPNTTPEEYEPSKDLSASE